MLENVEIEDGELEAADPDPMGGPSAPGSPLVSETPEMGAARFAQIVRALSDVARSGGLAVPGFRSPPSLPGTDRSIVRRGGRSVVAVRRRGRPARAIEADLIEGIVVANRLDPFDAARIRSQAWAALGVLAGSVVDDPASDDLADSQMRVAGDVIAIHRDMPADPSVLEPAVQPDVQPAAQLADQPDVQPAGQPVVESLVELSLQASAA